MSAGAASPQQSGRTSAYLRLAGLMMGSRITRALALAVAWGIADLLADEAKTAAELAAKVGLPEQSLRRLLRALSYAGVFEERAGGRFANNEVSAYLRSDHDPTLREMSLALNHESMLRAWQQLEKVLRTGNPVFAEIYGQSFFEQVAADPARSRDFARYMKGVYGPEGPAIATGFSFSRFPRIIDIGGGQGHILADILRAHPGVTGAVFDLPKTADVARQFLQGQGLGNRADVFAGDFLESVTPGYDAYFIKSTLHDWSDDKSVQILGNIRDAMPAHGSVLIAEIVLEAGKPIGHPHRFIDLEMMVVFGGKERTGDEFADLLQKAGLRLERVHTIEGSFFSIVEGAMS